MISVALRGNDSDLVAARLELPRTHLQGRSTPQQPTISMGRQHHAMRVPFGTDRSTVVITTPSAVVNPVNKNSD